WALYTPRKLTLCGSAVRIYILRILEVGIIRLGDWRAAAGRNAFFCAHHIFLRSACRLFLLLIQPLHFLLALLKCRRHFDSPLRYEGNCSLTLCTLLAKSCVSQLPAGLARAARGFAIILFRDALSAPAASAATTGTWAAAPWCFWARFVHFKVASTQLFAVQAGNGFGSFVVIGHFEKGKAAGSPGFPIHNQVNARHLSERLEQVAQFSFRGVKAHVTHKKILHYLLPKRSISCSTRKTRIGPSFDDHRSCLTPHCHGVNTSIAFRGKDKTRYDLQL